MPRKLKDVLTNMYLIQSIDALEAYMTHPKFNNWVDLHLGLQQLRNEINEDYFEEEIGDD